MRVLTLCDHLQQLKAMCSVTATAAVARTVVHQLVLTNSSPRIGRLLSAKHAMIRLQIQCCSQKDSGLFSTCRH